MWATMIGVYERLLSGGPCSISSASSRKLSPFCNSYTNVNILISKELDSSLAPGHKLAAEQL
jgi:hypothetical protein